MRDRASSSRLNWAVGPLVPVALLLTLATNACGQSLLGDMGMLIQREMDRERRPIPRKVQTLLNEATSAEVAGDNLLAETTLKKLLELGLEDPLLDARVQTRVAYFELARHDHDSGLARVRALSQHEVVSRVPDMAFYCDLQIAMYMAHARGNRFYPDFQPTMKEVIAAFDHVFTTYCPYRPEIIRAGITLAEKLVKEFSDRGYASGVVYGDMALEYLACVDQVLRETEAEPRLVEEPSVLPDIRDGFNGRMKVLSDRVASLKQEAVDRGTVSAEQADERSPRGHVTWFAGQQRECLGE